MTSIPRSDYNVACYCGLQPPNYDCGEGSLYNPELYVMTIGILITFILISIYWCGGALWLGVNGQNVKERRVIESLRTFDPRVANPYRFSSLPPGTYEKLSETYPIDEPSIE